MKLVINNQRKFKKVTNLPKLHILKHAMGQRWYQNRNYKVLWNKLKWNTTNQNWWDRVKEVLRKKFMSENTYIKIEDLKSLT